jgi:hypothetical protein
MTGALEAFAAFFGLDPDLVRAAAERSPVRSPSPDAVRTAIAAMSDGEKTAWLVRLFDGDPQAVAEWRAGVQLTPTDASPAGARTVSELQARARAIRWLVSARKPKMPLPNAAGRPTKPREPAAYASMPTRDAVMTSGARSRRKSSAGMRRVMTRWQPFFSTCARSPQGGTARRLRTIRERHVRKARFIVRLAVCQ